MAKWSEARWGNKSDAVVELPADPEPKRKWEASFNNEYFYFTASDYWEAHGRACQHWAKRQWGTPWVKEVE